MENNALRFHFETCLQKIKPSSQPHSETLGTLRNWTGLDSLHGSGS